MQTLNIKHHLDFYTEDARQIWGDDEIKMINRREGGEKKQVLKHIGHFLDHSYFWWGIRLFQHLLKWSQVSGFKGKMLELWSHRKLKCDTNYKLFVRRQWPNRLETTGLVFNHVCFIKALPKYPIQFKLTVSNSFTPCVIFIVHSEAYMDQYPDGSLPEREF